MATNEKVTEILNLMNDHPGLPVLPMVGTEIVADDTYAYWSASWGSAEVKKLCVADEHIVFWDEDYIWETWEDVGLDYESFGITEELSDEEAEKKAREILGRLLWTEAIVVYIETPDGDIPDNDKLIHTMYEEVRESE